MKLFFLSWCSGSLLTVSLIMFFAVAPIAADRDRLAQQVEQLEREVASERRFNGATTVNLSSHSSQEAVGELGRLVLERLVLEANWSLDGVDLLETGGQMRVNVDGSVRHKELWISGAFTKPEREAVEGAASVLRRKLVEVREAAERAKALDTFRGDKR